MMFALRRKFKEKELELEMLSQRIEADKKKHQMELDEIKHKHKLEAQEQASLLKLESQQKNAQAKLDYKKDLDTLELKYKTQLEELKTKHAQDIADIKAKSAKEVYEKVMAHDNKGADFVSEMALKMFDKGPMPAIAQIESKTTVVEAKAED